MVYHFFISFQKEASKGKELMHKTALRQLRHYANLKDGEKGYLVELLCKLKNSSSYLPVFTKIVKVMSRFHNGTAVGVCFFL